MTNLDKIRTMSPEELGTFLSNLVTIEDCFECPIRDVCNERQRGISHMRTVVLSLAATGV